MTAPIKVIPLLSQEEFKVLVPKFNPDKDLFKQIKLYEGQNKSGVVGLFDSELEKTVYFQAKSQYTEGNVRPDHPDLYVIYPNPEYRTYPFEQEVGWQEKKYQIPPSEWKLVTGFNDIVLMRKKRKEVEDLIAPSKIVEVKYNTSTTKVANKYDASKIKMELLPPLALEKIAKVFTYGAEKYSSWNWANGLNYSRVYGALQRHLNAWYKGEDRDFDPNCEGCKSGFCKDHSGENHLANAGCCLMMLLELAETRLDLDDRPPHYKPK